MSYDTETTKKLPPNVERVVTTNLDHLDQENPGPRDFARLYLGPETSGSRVELTIVDLRNKPNGADRMIYEYLDSEGKWKSIGFRADRALPFAVVDKETGHTKGIWDSTMLPEDDPKSEPVIFGRNSDPSVGVVNFNFPDTTSRRHFAMRSDERGLYVTDLGSSNGTYLELIDASQDVAPGGSEVHSKLNDQRIGQQVLSSVGSESQPGSKWGELSDGDKATLDSFAWHAARKREAQIYGVGQQSTESGQRAGQVFRAMPDRLKRIARDYARDKYGDGNVAF